MTSDVKEVRRVSTLELFFDLVFVFTLTQLTNKLAHDLTWHGVAQALLLLGVIWWMYGGYAWLTNTIVMDNRLRRAFLLTGMGGFLLIALAIPDMFESTNIVFGLGYILVTVVHSMFMMSAGGPSARWVMTRLAPLNLGSAFLVLAAGIAPSGIWRYILLGAALSLQIITPYLYPAGRGLSLTPVHFVERHGLVVIIALGESIVAIGVGLAGLELTPALVVMSLLCLSLSYNLWWCYFGSDNTRAEHAFMHVKDPIRRSRTALHAFGYAHYPMLLGIIIMSAGLKKTAGHPLEHAYLSTALLMAGGAAMFLLGETWFRHVLHIGRIKLRLLGSVVLFATVPIGVYGSAMVQVIAMTLILIAMFLIEYYGPDGEGHKVLAAQPS